jgi:Fur family transcriptional regulator, zinc uptake regulator
MSGRPRSLSEVAKVTRAAAAKKSPAAPIDVEALCRARGGRLTRQRWAVLQALIAAKRPLTAYELLDQLKPGDRSATPASTYRSLEFLVGVGLAHRLETTRSYVACGHPDHPHSVQFLICRTCGTVIEVEDKRIVRAADDLGERHGFALDQRTVELTGLCATCKDGHAESRAL